MNRVHSVLLLAGLTLATNAQSSPSFIPNGSNVTLGQSSNTQTIHSYTNNPAMGASALKDGDGNFKWGIISVTVGAEFGDMNNIEKTIEDLSNGFDGTTVNGPADIQPIVDSFNAGLAELDNNGTFKFSTNVSPASPLVIAANWLGGTLVFDINGSAAFKGQVLYDPIDSSGDPLVQGDDDVYYNGTTLVIENNDSTVMGSVAAIGEFSLAYSRLVHNNEKSDIYGGFRLKALRVGLVRDTIKLSDTNNNITSSIENYSADDIQTAMTADIGVLYTTDHYRIGATVNNITSPSFDYNKVDLSTYDNTTNVYSRLSKTQSFTMDRQFVLEGAWYSKNRYWVLNASYEVNAVTDPFGDDYQWFVVSAAYASDSFLIPGFRLGLRNNLAGSKLSYLTAGTTLFNIFNLDLAYSTESVEVDGSSYPRSFFASLGFSVNF